MQPTKQSFAPIIELLTLVELHVVTHIHLLVVALHRLVLVLPHEILRYYIILPLLHV
jgi:hypothetical protein